MNNQPTNPGLVFPAVVQMKKNLARLRELQSSTIETPGKSAEIAALEQSVYPVLLQHADAFVDGWLMQSEYFGLASAFANLTSRAQQIVASRK